MRICIRPVNGAAMPLAIMGISVAVAIITVIITPGTDRSTLAAAQEQIGAEPGPTGALRSGPKPPGELGGAAPHPGPGGGAEPGEVRGNEPPAPALPNKFELARFEEPSHPDYTLAKASRSRSQASGADGPAPRMPQKANTTLEWQMLEEGYSLARDESVGESQAAGPPE